MYNIKRCIPPCRAQDDVTRVFRRRAVDRGRRALPGHGGIRFPSTRAARNRTHPPGNRRGHGCDPQRGPHPLHRGRHSRNAASPEAGGVPGDRGQGDEPETGRGESGHSRNGCQRNGPVRTEPEVRFSTRREGPARNFRKRRARRLGSGPVEILPARHQQEKNESGRRSGARGLPARASGVCRRAARAGKTGAWFSPIRLPSGFTIREHRPTKTFAAALGGYRFRPRWRPKRRASKRARPSGYHPRRRSPSGANCASFGVPLSRDGGFFRCIY